MNIKNPVISIITPYYNAGEYIEETAKSVLSQTFPYFEWIIVDDGSSEEEKEKLKEIEKLDARIKVLRHIYKKEPTPTEKNRHQQNQQKRTDTNRKEPTPIENLGPAQARDLGIRNAAKSSKYIVFLDADDLYNKTFLECCFWTLETHPEASWTYTDSINFGAKNFLWRKWYDVEWELKENILIVSACVRKKDLIQVGGFGIKEKKVYEDWYLWLKLIKAGKYPIRMNSLLTYYRQKEGQSELKESNSRNKNNALKIINEVKKDLRDYKQGMQFPKYDYNWEEIKDENKDILDIHPKKFKRVSAKKQNAEKKVKKVNVLMIIPWIVTGGADRFNLNLVSKMDKKKFNFTIITTLPSRNEWRRYFEKHANIYDLTTFLDMKDWISFINYIIRKNNINLIFNSNSSFGYKILPYLKAKYPEIPIVDYVHIEEWYWRDGGYARDSSFVQKVIDKTFTCNENSRQVFIKSFNRKKSEIKTIYIGVDEKIFNPNILDKEKILKEIDKDNKISKKDKEGVFAQKIVISYVCRMADQKRPYLFLEIIKKLVKLRDDFIVVVAGDGPMLDGLKKKIQESKMDKFFIFTGNLKDTQKIYKISDLTLNTSIKEGLALTSYESLAMGVPVVSSDVGGQRELINEDVGIVVPCIQRENEISDFNYTEEEINGYVVAIQTILNNLKYYKSNCRKRIINHFTISKMIKNMEKEFIKIVEKPNDEKIKNAIELSNNIDILKELISTYIVSSKPEYEWLSEEFNKKNVHKNENKKVLKRAQFYEHTLEYKLKHPIVVALRKIGVYENLKRVLGMS